MAEGRPDTQQAQHDVFNARYWLCLLEQKRGNERAALQHLLEGYTTLSEMEARGLHLPAKDKKLLDLMRAELSAFKK